MSKIYRSKATIIEAVEFTDKTKDRVRTWVTCNTAADFENGSPVLKIQASEGIMTAKIGDYIIKDVSGEFYPCKPGIFQKTYEEVSNWKDIGKDFPGPSYQTEGWKQ